MIVCLFDIDGTLLGSGGAGKAALEAALAEQFGISHLIEALRLSGRTDRAIVADLFRVHGVPETLEAREQLLSAYLRHLPACLAASPGQVLPGVVALLERLRQRSDVSMGLLTGNIRAGARVKLSHHGIFDYFSFGGFGDHHLDRDDVAREALREARQRHENLEPDQVWVLGDTPLDIRCARAIGAKALAVCTGWHDRAELASHKPDLLVDDLRDAEPLFASWDARKKA